MMELLVNGRKKINGELVVADGVVDDLYNAGAITYAEKKYLKSIKQNKLGQMTTGRASGSGRKPTFKRSSVPTVAKVKLPAKRSTASISQPLNLKVNLKRTIPRVRLKTK